MITIRILLSCYISSNIVLVIHQSTLFYTNKVTVLETHIIIHLNICCCLFYFNFAASWLSILNGNETVLSVLYKYTLVMYTIILYWVFLYRCVLLPSVHQRWLSLSWPLPLPLVPCYVYYYLMSVQQRSESRTKW